MKELLSSASDTNQISSRMDCSDWKNQCQNSISMTPGDDLVWCELEPRF